MRTPMRIVACVAAFLTAWCATVAAEDQAPAGTPGELSGGTGVRAVDQSQRSAAFGRYRDLEDGFVWDWLAYGYLGPKQAWFLDFDAKNILRDDESYRLDAGLHGRFKLSLSYDAIPRLYTREAKSFLNLDGDTFRVADQIQRDFEALDDTTSLPAGDTAGTVTLANDLLDQESRFDVGLRRQGGGVTGEWRVTDRWGLRLEAWSERRSGRKTLSGGSYIRTAIGSGSTHTEDDFRVLGHELAAPVDDRTTRLSLGSGASGKRWMVDGRIDLSRFENDIDTLTFDNPFRATDFASGTFRNRFAQGRYDLAPENTARSATVTGSVSLPARSRLTGTVTYGIVEQDDAFPAYTMNTAISTAAGFDVTDVDNLPAGDLDGEVRNSMRSLIFSSRPVKPVSITAKYRFYEYDNRSDEIVFPGYAAFGESDWRTNIVAGVPISNPIQSYETTDVSLDVTWRIASGVSVRGSAGMREWAREERAIEDSDETTLGAAVILDPADWLSITGSYAKARRDIDDDEYAPELEAPFLRQFDQAQRDRDTAGLIVQISAGDHVSVGASYDSLSDEYPDTSFGLIDSKGFNGAVDVTFTPAESLTFFAMAGRERREDRVHSIAKDDATVTGIAPGYTPNNRWNSGIDDEVVTWGAGARLSLISDRLDLEARYDRSRGRTEFDNANPVKPVKLVNAEAAEWPDQESDLSDASLKVGWRARPDVTVGVRWIYEDYDLDDFTWERVRPYSFAVTDPTFSESRRFLFLDSTYGGYKGSIVAVFVNYAF